MKATKNYSYENVVVTSTTFNWQHEICKYYLGIWSYETIVSRVRTSPADTPRIPSCISPFGYPLHIIHSPYSSTL